MPILEEHLGESTIQHNRADKAVMGLLHYLYDFHILIEDGAFTEDEVEYTEYLDTYLDTDSSQGGRHSINSTDIDHMLGKESLDNLIGTHYQGPSFAAVDSDVQFHIIYVHIRSFIEVGLDFSQLKSLLEEYENKYTGRSLFLLLKSEIFQRGYSQRHFREAIKSANEALKISSENPKYLLAFVNSAIKFIHGSPDLELDIDELPSKREELLEHIDNYSYRLVSQSPESVQAHSSRSEVLELQGEFQSAERELNQAIKIANQEESVSTRPLEMQLSELRRIRENANRAERAFSEVKTDIEGLRDQSESVEQKLRQDMENYRNQMLQFIVFFTGILAVIFVSIQVALQLQSVEDVMRVVIVLTGSIIVAFSTLSLTVFSNDDDNKLPNWVIALIIGIGILLLGYFLPKLTSYFSI